MRDAELRRAFGFVVGQLTEIIVKTIGGTAVETRPEGWLTDGRTAGGRHINVVVSRSTDHVSVGFDIAHYFAPGYAPMAPLPGATAMGSVVWSLRDNKTRFARSALPLSSSF